MSNVFELPAHDGAAARDSTPADWARLERNAAEIFTALGLDLDTPGTRDTPRRFVRALFDATAGYDGDPKLRTRLPDGAARGRRGPPRADRRGPDRRSTRCASTTRCRSTARAHVGYVAGDEILGISQAHAARAPLRAALHACRSGSPRRSRTGCSELAGARGVAVRLEAAHLCTAMRGVEEDGSRHGHDRLARPVRRGRVTALASSLR